MKNALHKLQSLLPHGVIILSLMFAVFLVLDEYNPMMQFVDCTISRVLLGLLALFSIVTACLLIQIQRRCKK
jgi:hypothetical protein